MTEFVYISNITRDRDATKEVWRWAGIASGQSLGLGDSAAVSQVGPIPVTGRISVILKCGVLANAQGPRCCGEGFPVPLPATCHQGGATLARPDGK